MVCLFTKSLFNCCLYTDAMDKPMFRLVQNPENPLGAPLLQKRIKAHAPHEHHYHSNKIHHHGVIKQTVDEPEADILNEDGEELSIEEKVRSSYDEKHMYISDKRELC